MINAAHSYQAIKAEKIARFIDEHHMPRPTEVNADGTLTVYCEEIVLSTREVRIVAERIPATMAAARAILGY